MGVGVSDGLGVLGFGLWGAKVGVTGGNTLHEMWETSISRALPSRKRLPHFPVLLREWSLRIGQQLCKFIWTYEAFVERFLAVGVIVTQQVESVRVYGHTTTTDFPMNVRSLTITCATHRS